MNFEDTMLSETSQPVKTNSMWFHVYEIPTVITSTETEGGMVARDGVQGRMVISVSWVQRRKIHRLCGLLHCTTM